MYSGYLDHRLPEAMEKADSNRGRHLNEDGIPEACSDWPTVSTLVIPALKRCLQHGQRRGVPSDGKKAGLLER